MTRQCLTGEKTKKKEKKKKKKKQKKKKRWLFGWLTTNVPTPT